MTERKPGDVSFEGWIEYQIRRAQEAGAFDNLGGAGKPLPGIDRPPGTSAPAERAAATRHAGGRRAGGHHVAGQPRLSAATPKLIGLAARISLFAGGGGSDRFDPHAGPRRCGHCADVSRVRGDHGIAATARSLHYRDIDDVVVAGLAREYPDPSGLERAHRL